MESATQAGAPQERLSAERNRMLYAALPSATGASAVLAALVVFVLADQVGWVRCAVWFGFSLCVTAWRLSALKRYNKYSADLSQAAVFERRFVYGAAASGMVWGVACLLLFPSEPAHQAFLAFVIAGVSAGAVSSLGASNTASRSGRTMIRPPDRPLPT